MVIHRRSQKGGNSDTMNRRKNSRNIYRFIFSFLIILVLAFGVMDIVPSEADSIASTTYSFDEGFDGWTTIDADGDGHDWFFTRDMDSIYDYYSGVMDWDDPEKDYFYSGTGSVASGSYINGVGVLTPNNYLVSPKVELGGSISFYTCPLDNNYYYETIGVFVSTNSNTNPADFTEVGSWTLTDEHWKQYTVDLSAYSGEGYIAIRHYNSVDVYIFFFLDEVTITAPGSSGGHEFSYSADGATVTATCTEQDCSLPDGQVSFSIIAPEKTVYGDGKDAEASFSNAEAFAEATGIDVNALDVLYSGRGTTSYSATADAPTAPGSYTATVYLPGNVTGAESTLTAYVEYEISPATLTITANDIEKEEGSLDPELTYSVEGLLEGDSITGELEREEGEEPGEYDILIGNLSAGDNYTINFVGAKLTIKGADTPVEPEPEEPESPLTSRENDMVLYAMMLVISFAMLVSFALDERYTR